MASTFNDIVQKIFGLDQSKQYEVDIKEAIPDPIVPPTPPAETPPTPLEPNSTVETKDNDIAAMQEQIKSLQAANLALLNRLPVNTPEKSTEELIYDLCVGSKQERSNAYGIYQTGNRSEHRSQSDLSYS